MAYILIVNLKYHGFLNREIIALLIWESIVVIGVIYNTIKATHSDTTDENIYKELEIMKKGYLNVITIKIRVLN